MHVQLSTSIGRICTVYTTQSGAFGSVHCLSVADLRLVLIGGSYVLITAEYGVYNAPLVTASQCAEERPANYRVVVGVNAGLTAASFALRTSWEWY